MLISDGIATHHIRQVVFELSYPDETAALRQRKQVEETFYQTILPVLEEVFDRCALPGQLYQLERLEINLGAFNPLQIDDGHLRQLLLTQLDERLRGAAASAASATGAANLLTETVTHFLTNGYWPWQAPYTNLAQVEALILALGSGAARQFAQQLLPLLSQPSVRLRLVEQFGVALLDWLLAQLYPAQALVVEQTAHRLLADLPAAIRWQHLLAVISTLPADQPIDLLELEQRLRAQRLPPSLATPPAQTDKLPKADAQKEQRSASALAKEQASPQAQTAIPAEGLYVTLAGIVLLHPYLDRFFRRLDLVVEGRTLATLDQQVRAVHLLYYLATGQEQPEEQETTLLKLLCGLPLTWPLVKALPLRPEEREEADALLQAVIEHWSKLKNTSPAALRATFLQRSGKVMVNNDQWRLVVEQQSVDILLNYLPWPISLVRLPWLGAPLWVDWA